MSAVVLGGVEEVSFPDFDGLHTVAKVDTGAWGCSLHCEDIRIENQTLFFRPITNKNDLIETKNFSTALVKSSNGEEERRYVVEMKVCIRGIEYTTEMRLADRTQMRRDMLIGRRFLLRNNMIVDVSLTSNDDDEAKEEDL